MWLVAIGLSAKLEVFQENAVDGDMLVSLSDEDYTQELGLTTLQVRKLRQKLDFSNSLVGEGGASANSKEQEEIIAALEAENAKLEEEVKQLKGVIKVLNQPQQAAPAPAPKPAPAPAPAPQQHHRQPGLVGGGARGAARGAALGAIGGAIAGDAGKGAKIGAAVGGTQGALRGGLARRGRR